MKKCRICNKEYNGDIPHYCEVCGHNISSQIEKTDVILFFSYFLRTIGLAGVLFFTWPITSCALDEPFCMDGSCIGGGSLTIIEWIITFIPVYLIVLSFVLRHFFKKLCLKNIKKTP